MYVCTKVHMKYADLVFYMRAGGHAFLIGHLYLSGMYMPYGKASS
jgi:hypothetical protein